MSFLQLELLIELIKALILGFTVGISAAMIPGPMMFTTVGIALKKGWKTGFFIFSGHALVESMIFVLILVGVATLIGEEMISHMAIFGGLVMLIRLVGEYPEGVMYAILIMNAVTPLIDRFCKLVPAGGKTND